MRLYKLLKDLPTVKAGAIFKEKIKIESYPVENHFSQVGKLV